MTELHWVLLGFAAVLVAGVFAYNAIQERRLRKMLEAALQRGHDERNEVEISPIAEADSQLAEPGFPDLDLADLASEEPNDLHKGTEPADMEQVAVALDAKEADNSPELVIPPGILDLQTEYIVQLRFLQPTRAPFAELRRRLMAAAKPARVMGLRVSSNWEPVSAEVREAVYSVIEVGILLANRAGPLQGNQLNEFCTIVREFGAVHGAEFECPDTKGVFDHARELDAFCLEVDVVLGINVIAPTGFPFHIAAVHRLASDAGMEFEPGAGVHFMRDATGQILFSLMSRAPELDGIEEANSGVTQAIVISLDVPRVPGNEAVFDRMVSLAEMLASALSGTVADDHGRVLTQANLDVFREKLAEFHAKMRERGIEPGGERALRLFS